MRRIIDWAQTHPVAVLTTMVIVVLIAIVNAGSMPVTFMPEVERPVFIVRTELPGLPSAEVVDLLTRPVERALSGIGGVAAIRSTTRAGVSAVEVRFHAGVSREHARAEVRQVADRVYPGLPDAADRPSVLSVPVFREPAAIIAVLPGRTRLGELQRLADRQLRSQLQQLPGTGTITVTGGERAEVHVRVDPHRIAAKGVAFGHVSGAIETSVFEHAVGTIQVGERELSVVTDAAVATVDALGGLPVAGEPGDHPVLLRDVAVIEAGVSEQQSMFSYQGEEAVGISIYARPGHSPPEVARRVVAFVSAYNAGNTGDVRLVIAADGAEPLRNAVQDIVISGLLGSVCAFCVIIMFSRSPVLALPVVCSIPASLALTLLLLQQSGLGVNLMSLSGLLVAIGMIVDNSIVVAENLALKPDRPGEAVHEVAAAGVSGTATTIVVFIPLAGLPGLLGSIYRDLVITVALALVSSYIVSLLLVPTLRALFPAAAPPGTREDAWTSRFAGSLVSRRGTTGFASLAMLGIAIGGSFLVSCSPTEALDSGTISVRTRTDANSPFASVRAQALALEALIAAHESVRDVHSLIGGEPDDPVFLSTIDLEPREIRSTVRVREGSSVFDVVSDLGRVFARAGIDASITVARSPLARIVHGELSRGEAVGGATVAEATEAAHTILAQYNPDMPGRARAAAIVPSASSTSVYVRPRMPTLQRYGMNAADVTRLLYAQTTGIVTGSIHTAGVRNDVRVFFGSDAERSAAEDLVLVSGTGDLTSLSQIADLERVDALLTRIRVNQTDTVYLSAGFGPEVPAPSLSRSDLYRLYLVFAGAAAILFLVLVFHFNQITHALAIMCIIPVSWAGALCALTVTGRVLTLESGVGLLILTGLTVNPGIILIETYEALRRRGHILRDAIHDGTARRLRPVLMTGITTVAALVPLAIDPGLQSMQSNTAIVVIGGISAGTIATLTVIPRLYLRSCGNGLS
ncbi:MAG: efflux RND transporter permease subunit [bacterium]